MVKIQLLFADYGDHKFFSIKKRKLLRAQRARRCVCTRLLVAVAYVLRRWLRICPCVWLCICLGECSLARAIWPHLGGGLVTDTGDCGATPLGATLGTPLGLPLGCPQGSTATDTAVTHCARNLAPTWGGLGHRHRGLWGAPTGCTPGCVPWVHPRVAPRCCARVPAGARACPRARRVRVGAHACPRVRHAGVGARTCPRARRVGAWERGCAPVGCHLGGSLPHMAWLLQLVFEMVAFPNWQARTPCGQANCQVFG